MYFVNHYEIVDKENKDFGDKFGVVRVSFIGPRDGSPLYLKKIQ